MTAPEFSELVSRLIEAMGQQTSAVRSVPEGLLLRTGDGFLYAFLEDPTQISLETVRRLIAEVGDAPMKLAILTPGKFPLALLQEVVSKGGSVVDGARFAELAKSLGLASYLGSEPRPEPPPSAARLLPSARQLDEIMRRAKTWLDWGVPALALRFFRQSLALKPEFSPARVGVGRSLLALGLAEDADRSFGEVLAFHPDDLDARLGRAAVLGARGRIEEEIRVYRRLLDETGGRLDIRAHLVAALIAEKKWEEARKEIEAMLKATPEDPQMRYLHAASLYKSGHSDQGDRERDRAHELGLTYERELSLSEHLGLPPPAKPMSAAAPEVAAAPPRLKRPARPRAAAKPVHPPKRRASSPRKPPARRTPARAGRKAK